MARPLAMITRLRPILGPFVTAGITSLGVIASCGPSYQAVYEGNVRFEHCYRLDIDPGYTVQHRRRCWREFLELYTYGQTQDRVQYARDRVRALGGGDAESPVRPDALDAGAPRRATGAPAPTDPHAPPPPVTPMADSKSPQVQRKPDASVDAAPLPGETCVTGCRKPWRRCVLACDTDAATAAACEACGQDYRNCMRRCFE